MDEFGKGKTGDFGATNNINNIDLELSSKSSISPYAISVNVHDNHYYSRKNDPYGYRDPFGTYFEQCKDNNIHIGADNELNGTNLNFGKDTYIGYKNDFKGNVKMGENVNICNENVFNGNIKVGKNVNIGNNNTFEGIVEIKDNVKIGNNNIIKSGTVIYPNTVIGNDNVIMENNTLGSLAVEANKEYKELEYNGLKIGNNNIFHMRNIISSGCYKKTLIGNNNKILSDVYISHDNIVGNNVTFYPRVFSAGLVQYMDYCSVGANACIHQNLRIGEYSMIGMNNTIVKDVRPYMVCINGKYTRLNHKKLVSNICNEKIGALNNILPHLKNNKTPLSEIALHIDKNYLSNVDQPNKEIYQEIKNTLLSMV